MAGFDAKSFDLVVADPPYQYRHTPVGSTNNISLSSAKGMMLLSYGDESSVIDYDGWLTECERLLVDGGSILIFEHPSAIGRLIPAIQAAGFTVRWSAVLNVIDRQPITSSTGMRPISKHDVMIWSVKGDGEPYLHHGFPTPRDVHSCPQVRCRGGSGFAGKKPIPMLREWIHWLTPEDGWVLDPFLGSGSTLKACWDCDRHGVGIEIEEGRRDMIASRLGENQSKLDVM